ncbi:hypothetical protein, partial [Candidatus Albibeggiatoa sp. nov. BB20]|uniref:hypothetical protein n=1 Tax=Candidatus Albibeggiatoa sp. nov. BB20 TaxID=3162723 RepID=UPI0033659D8E
MINNNKNLKDISALHKINKIESFTSVENHPEIDLTPMRNIEVTGHLVLADIKKENLPIFNNIKILSKFLVIRN